MSALIEKRICPRCGAECHTLHCRGNCNWSVCFRCPSSESYRVVFDKNGHFFVDRKNA